MGMCDYESPTILLQGTAVDFYKQRESQKCTNRVWENDDSDGKCIIHAEVRQKPLDEILRVLPKKDKTNARILHQPYFEGVNFSDAQYLQDRTDVNKINFSGDTLVGANFRSAKFGLGIDFSETVFEAGVDFVDTDFYLEVNFIDSKFETALKLGDTQSPFGYEEEIASFEKAEFHHFSDFSRARFEAPAEFSNSVFVKGASYSDAIFDREFAFVGTKFHEFSDFSGATLRNGNFKGCMLEEARFRDADLSGTDLRDSLVDQVDFSNVRVDINTKFHDGEQNWEVESKLKNAYESLADWSIAQEEYNNLQPDKVNDHFLLIADKYFTEKFSENISDAKRGLLTQGLHRRNQKHLQVEALRRAQQVYLNYQRLLQENGYGVEAGKYNRRRKDVERKLAIAKTGRNGADEESAVSRREQMSHAVDWFELASERWILGYGEKPWYVLKISLGVIVVFTLIYAIFGVSTPDNTVYRVSFSPNANIIDSISLLYWSFLLSISTFLLAGEISGVEIAGDTYPAIAFGATTIEAIMGASLLALFFFVVGRAVER